MEKFRPFETKKHGKEWTETGLYENSVRETQTARIVEGFAKEKEKTTLPAQIKGG